MKKLIAQTLSSFLIGSVVLGALLFLPAWTLNYWQAWVFIVVFMTSVNVIGLYLALKDPALLERRKKFGPAKEQSPAQKVAISIGVLALLGVLVFSAFAHRFGWSPVPTYARWPATHWLRWGSSLLCSCSRKTATEDPPLRRLRIRNSSPLARMRS